MSMENAIKQLTRKRVIDIINKEVVTVDENDSIVDIAKLMSGTKSSYCLVMRENKVVGIITEKDIVRRVVAEERDPSQLKAVDIMSAPVIAVASDTELEDAVMLMAKNNIRKLAVLDDEDRLIGVITVERLASELAALLKFENILLNAFAVSDKKQSRIYG